MSNQRSSGPAWWGGRAHVVFTVVVFVVLASLDNAAIGAIPAMVKPLTSAFDVSESAVTILTGAQIFLTALVGVVWGYAGDSRSRKRLLLWGTVIWAGALLASTTASSFVLFALWQMVVAIGLGSIASVGFSVVSDLIAPKRRGLAMSFWGLSQGIGVLVGGLLASQLGADAWQQPLMAIGIAGLAFAALYVFTYDAPRGFKEPELAAMRERGVEYEYRIDRSQLPAIAKRKTNLWLILQGLTAQIAYGSLIWVTLLYQEKVLAQGYSESTATKVGGIFAAIFTVGALFSILAGHIGDRMQSRTLRGRAIVSAVGILGAIPFFLVFFWVPLRGLDVTEGAGTVTLAGEVLTSLVTNPWSLIAFLSGVGAIALTSADSPNWFALITDVNLPEHRGTVFGAGNLANGVGRSIGSAVTGPVANALERAVPAPWNWALGLTVFQVFFLPTGYCYWRASQTCPADITEVREIMGERAAAASER
ncbi:MAG TPA: MFS transporter [Acidimicrobiia bacterium]|nr:MFS transporter [Acidimicrobiia bacterium]